MPVRAFQFLVVATIALTPAVACADPAQPSPPPTQQNTTPPGETVVVQSTAPVQETVQDSLNEIVCRTAPPAIGSRLGGGRECHTQRQWNQRQREDQRMLQRLQTLGWRP
jgi:hypothetical protein